MGNISSNNNYSEQFPLDNCSVVALRKTKSRKRREVVDTWSAEYLFERTTCELNMTKTNRNNYDEQELSISIHDHASTHANDYVDFQMNMRVEERLLNANLRINGPRCMQQPPERKTHMGQGGVFKSSSFLYGRDNDRRGLIVVLRAKNIDDDGTLPYMITVKHYFVAECCSHGVSVVAKIRSGEGGLSVEIEKPSIESKRSLLSMFEDVKGKGWCPNSNSSDLDRAIELPNQNKYPANPYDSISGQLMTNGGNFHGNGNGSIYNIFVRTPIYPWNDFR